MLRLSELTEMENVSLNCGPTMRALKLPAIATWRRGPHRQAVLIAARIFTSAVVGAGNAPKGWSTCLQDVTPVSSAHGLGVKNGQPQRIGWLL